MIRDHRSRGDGPKRRDGRQNGTKGDRLTSRVGVLLVAMSLLVAACGSRESGPPAVGAEGSGAAAPTTTSSDRVGDNGKVGTLEPACGSGNPAHGATARGVTDTTITIGVISDKSGVVAVPTAGIDGSVDAFVRILQQPRRDQRAPARAQTLRLEDPQRGRRDEAGVRRRHLRARRLGLRARRSGRGGDGAVRARRGRRRTPQRTSKDCHRGCSRLCPIRAPSMRSVPGSSSPSVSPGQ